MRTRLLAPLLSASMLALLAPAGAPSLLLRPARADFAVPGFELIYTAPVETALQRPALRSAVAAWTELFDGARKTLDLEQMYVSWKAGEPLDPVLAALERAGARGVRVRFLVDEGMAEKDPASLERLRRVPGLELRRLSLKRLRGRGFLHAKYIVADGRAGYVGSQNFDWRSLKHVQELGLLVRDGEIAAQMQAVFDRDWALAADPARPARPAPAAEAAAGPPAPSLSPAGPERRAYLVASPACYNPPGVGDSEAELVRLIGTAQEEIAVQVLDYAPLSRRREFYPPIDNALRAAAARGVKVRLIVSNWNADPPGIDHLKSLGLLPGVSIRMVTLPEARQGFIPYARVVHAKYMTVDGKLLWLGTSNWTGGYLDDARNLELVVKDPRLAAEVRALHEQLWTSPYAEALDPLKTYPRARRH